MRRGDDEMTTKTTDVLLHYVGADGILKDFAIKIPKDLEGLLVAPITSGEWEALVRLHTVIGEFLDDFDEGPRDAA
jgi:hypothetical protein